MRARIQLLLEAFGGFQLAWLVVAAVAMLVAWVGEGEGIDAVFGAVPLLGALVGWALRVQWMRDGRWWVVQSVGWSPVQTARWLVLGVLLGGLPLFAVRELSASLALQAQDQDWVLLDADTVQRGDGLAVAWDGVRLRQVEAASQEDWAAAYRAQHRRGPLWAAVGQGEPARGARLAGALGRWAAAGLLAAAAWGLGAAALWVAVPWWVLQQVFEQAGLAGLAGGWSVQLAWLAALAAGVIVRLRSEG